MTLDDLKPFIDWLQANPHWAGLATFVISIAESLAIIGLLIPGTIVMGAIGSLVGSGVLPSLSIIAWASAGAIVGDGISYWLGFHYHEHIRVMWPFRLMPGLLKKGETFFLKHGGKSVFMGRFIGPIRPIIPVIAGMMNMSPMRFTIANITSAITWAPAYMLPGYVLGAVSVQLAPHTASRFLIMAILALLAIWFCYWISKQVCKLLLRWADAGLNKLWLTINSPTSWLSPLRECLTDPLNPKSYSELAILLAAMLTLALFMWLSIARSYPCLDAINHAIWTLARNIRLPQLDKIMLPMALLAELPIIESLLAAVLVWLLIKSQWRTAYHWLLNGLLTVISVSLLQVLFKTSLPEGLRLSLTGWSYPSLSIALSTAVLGFLSVILARQTWRHYTWYYFITLLLILAIGLSRCYFGAAWFTDILGGYLIGLACVLLTTLSYRRQPLVNIKAWSLALISILALSVSWTWHYLLHSEQLMLKYLPYQPAYTLNSADWWLSQEHPQNLYRENLLGKSIELLNLQWAGNIDEIKQHLKQQGWQVEPKPNLAIVINRIAAKNRDAQLPVFPYIYLHKKPALIMTKYTATPSRMLVLRLWNANLSLADKNLPLYLGSVAYNKPWKFNFPYSSTQHQTDYKYQSAMQKLEQDIGNFTWKEVPVNSELCKAIKEGCSSNILLIQPRLSLS